MLKTVTALIIASFLVGCAMDKAQEAQLSQPTAETPALPGWSYAKWGMSPEELVSASSGDANFLTEEQRRDSSTGLENALVGSLYATGNLNFEVAFRFSKDTQKLTSVNLRLIDSKQKRDLVYSLNEKYGPPISQDLDGTFSTVRWWTPQLDIFYLSIGDGASVTYTPREQASGL